MNIRLPVRIAAWLVLDVGLLAQGGYAASIASQKLQPCHVPGVAEEVRCGRYDVFEDRAARKGRKIGLNIVVLPAQGPEVASDPLVFLAGGGVAPATGYAGFLSEAYAGLRRGRDVLLVDQRGTGGSNPLDCELSTDPLNAEYRDDQRFLAAVRRCRQELERKADLHDYTTPIAMDDLDEVRSWLGYERLNLFGVSYGTTAAMVYLRQHGDRVRTVALQGVIPFDVPMWLEVPRSAQLALDEVFAACARQATCHAAFPGLREEFWSVLKRLDDKAVRVAARPEDGGQDADVTIDGEALRVFVLKVLYASDRIHDLPLIVHLAYQGDYRPLASRLVPRGPSEIPKGVYLSIVCSEIIPLFDPAALPEATAGTFMGGFRLGREVSACREWVAGGLPQDFHTPVRSDVPVLVMNGALDHVTPPRYGERVAHSLTQARQLVLPRRGHNDTDACVNGIIQGFMIAGSLAGLDTSCLATTEDLSFALQREDLAETPR